MWAEVHIAPAGPHEPVLPPRVTCHHILATLCEANFRLEVLALDFFCYSPTRNTVGEVRDPLQRRADVLQLMRPWKFTLFPDDFTAEDGTASMDLEERWEVAWGLMMVMQDWVRIKRCLPPEYLYDITAELVHIQMADGVKPAAKIEALERGVIDHYIRSYAYVFARAPSIPHLAVKEL